MSVIAVVVIPDAALSRRPLAGRSLIAHALTQALAARKVLRTFVVTGDDAIARLANDLGAEVVKPAKAEHGAQGAPALTAVLAALETDGSFLATAAVLLTPEFPLRTAAMIDDVIDHFAHVGADTLLTVHPLTDPLWIRDEGGIAQPADPRPTRQRFVENGLAVVVRIAAFEREGTIPCGRIVLCEQPQSAALRLRSEDDWSSVEAWVQHRRDRDLVARLRSIRLLALDFDGVITDNRVIVFEDGREAVLCNRSDGLGFDRLRAAGLPVVVISKERNPVVAARCRKLQLPCHQGIEDKLAVLTAVAAEHRIPLSQVAFFGNDINDLPCLNAAGLALAPADAHRDVLVHVDHVTTAPGGAGAVREICDLWLAARAEA